MFEYKHISKQNVLLILIKLKLNQNGKRMAQIQVDNALVLYDWAIVCFACSNGTNK